MGRIYDALRRAEQERRQRRHGDAPEPAVVVDTSRATGREPDLERPAPAIPGSRVAARADPPSGTAEPGAAPGAPARADGGPAARRRPVAAAARPSPREPEAPPRGGRGGAAVPGPTLFAVADPASPAAEHLRAVRSRILRAFEERGYRSLLITSPGRGEGKSLAAANLALLLAAEIDRRVLLIDGDLRKSTVARRFGVAQEPGLADVLLGRTAWPEAITAAPWNDLHLLPAGARTGGVTELLNGPAARRFFREVRDAYDVVVVDAPPVLPVADSAVLSGLVDTVVLVARAEQTPREALAQAVDALGKANLIGLILNALPDRLLVRRGYYAY